MDPWSYFLQFLSDPKVGALGPTSKECIRKITDPLPFHQNITVLEWGPGDGVTSKEILSRMNHDSKLIGLETNQAFCEELGQWEDPRLSIYHSGAEETEQVMEKEGVDQVDAIVSGIPFTYFRKKEKEELIEKAYSILKPGGVIVVYQLSRRMYPLLQRHFTMSPTRKGRSGLFPMFIMSGQKPS